MKLHIGGEQAKEGWKIFSIQKKNNVDFVGDISDLNQFKTESIDEIYASHVLEHVGRFKVTSTLQGIYRVLKKKENFMFLFQIWIYLLMLLLAHKHRRRTNFVL